MEKEASSETPAEQVTQSKYDALKRSFDLMQQAYETRFNELKGSYDTLTKKTNEIISEINKMQKEAKAVPAPVRAPVQEQAPAAPIQSQEEPKPRVQGTEALPQLMSL